MDLARVCVVLVEVRSPENLGAVARAMNNAGLSRLVLVNPQTADFDLARRVAVDSEVILERAAFATDIVQAVGPATLVAGTTSRPVEGRLALDPRALAEAVDRETARGEVALVFGSERRGLSNTEIDHCQVVATIPASPAKPSLNLAQAVAIVGYELFVRSLSPGPTAILPSKATAEALERLYQHARDVLLATGFLNPQNPDLILSEFKRFVERSRPSAREAELILAALKQIKRLVRP